MTDLTYDLWYALILAGYSIGIAGMFYLFFRKKA